MLSKTPFLQKLGGTSRSSKERSCEGTPSHPSLLAMDHPGSEPSCLDSDPSTAGGSIKSDRILGSSNASEGDSINGKTRLETREQTLQVSFVLSKPIARNPLIL